VRAGIQEALGRALDSFEVMRSQEGRAIEEDFVRRLTLITEYLDGIEGRAPIMIEEYRRRLRDRINKLSQDIELDGSRLIQEVAIFAERCDITEEIVRMRSHLDQFNNYMSMEDAIGRRLDFLIQEMNREVNTIGAKTFDSSTSATGSKCGMKGDMHMVHKLVNIGFGNSVVSRRVVAIISPNAAPIKRLRDEAREEKRLIDGTQGRKTRSVIITDSNHVILSAIQSETIAQRFSPDITLTKEELEE
ncbi:MAG: DUF1732 domain-containing protein, partial [Deltaproteobacteria bacterium]|nr:DUF1732 domain-containing protein [Deltaproteobacteria bacterium]